MYSMTPGWPRHVGTGSFVNPETNAEYLAWIAAGNTPIPYVPPHAGVPQVVSRFQARMALHGAGLMTAVEAIMANPQTPLLAREAWANALEFRRDSPTIAALSGALGLTNARLDDLFIAAAQIEA